MARKQKRNLTKAERREIASLRDRIRELPMKNYSFVGEVIDALRSFDLRGIIPTIEHIG